MELSVSLFSGRVHIELSGLASPIPPIIRTRIFCEPTPWGPVLGWFFEIPNPPEHPLYAIRYFDVRDPQDDSILKIMTFQKTFPLQIRNGAGGVVTQSIPYPEEVRTSILRALLSSIQIVEDYNFGLAVAAFEAMHPLGENIE